MSSAAPPSNDAHHKADQGGEWTRGSGSRSRGRGGRGRGGGDGNPRGRGRGRGQHRGGAPPPSASESPAPPSLLSRLGPAPLATDLTPSTTPFPSGRPDSPATSVRSGRGHRHRKSSTTSNISVSVPGSHRSRNNTLIINNAPKTPLSATTPLHDLPPHLAIVPETTTGTASTPLIANAAAHILAVPDSSANLLRAASPQPQPSSRPYTPQGRDWAGDDDDDNSLPDLDDWGVGLKGEPSDMGKSDSLQLHIHGAAMAKALEAVASRNTTAPSGKAPVLGAEPGRMKSVEPGHLPSRTQADSVVPVTPPRDPTSAEPTGKKLPDRPTQHKKGGSISSGKSPLNPSVSSVVTGATTISVLPPTPVSNQKATRNRSARGNPVAQGDQAASKTSGGPPSSNSSDGPRMRKASVHGGNGVVNPATPSPPAKSVAEPSELFADTKGVAPSTMAPTKTASSPTSNLTASRPTHIPNELPSGVPQDTPPASAGLPPKPETSEASTLPVKGGPLAARLSDAPVIAPSDSWNSPPPTRGHRGRGSGGRGGRGGSGSFSHFHSNNPSSPGHPYGRGGSGHDRTHSNASSIASVTSPIDRESNNDPSSPPSARRGHAPSHSGSRSTSRPILSSTALSRLNSSLTQSPPKRVPGGPLSSSPRGPSVMAASSAAALATSAAAATPAAPAAGTAA